MENPDNEDFITPVCILLIAAGLSNTEVSFRKIMG
jgi:hypothetical protein